MWKLRMVCSTRHYVVYTDRPTELTLHRSKQYKKIRSSTQAITLNDYVSILEEDLNPVD